MSGNDTHATILQKAIVTIAFEVKIETPGGVIQCGYFKQGHKIASTLGDMCNKISVDQAYCLLSHLNET